MSSDRSLTRSQARSLLSIARLKMTRSRHDRAISRRTRMDQTCFGSRGFLADEQSLIPSSLAFADRTYKHGGFLRHPALRVALWRAWYYSDKCAFPCPNDDFKATAYGAKRPFISASRPIRSETGEADVLLTAIENLSD